MYKKMLGLARDTLVYGLGAFANMAVSGLLLLPVYGRYLTKAEYGAYSVLRVMMVVLTILYDLGISSTLVRFYFDEQTDEERKRLFGTAFIFAQVVALAMTVLLFTTAGFWSELLVGKGGKAIYVQIIALQAFFATGIIIPQSLFRARRKPAKFAIFQFVNVLIMIAATTYLVVWAHMGLVGALGGMLISAVVFYFVSLIIIIPNIRFTIWIAKLKAMLAFSLPLLPHALAGWVLNFSDRILLRTLLPGSPTAVLDQVAIYSYGYNIGMVMSLLVLATQKSWPQFVFSSHAEMEEPRAKRLFSRTASYYLIFLCAAALAVAVFAPEMLQIAAGGRYSAAAPIVPVISMAYLFLGLYTVVGVGIGIKKKSKYYFAATGAGAAANVALNIVVIPRFGIMGAALATVLAYVVMSAVVYVLSQGLYRIDYEELRIGLAFVLAVGAFALSSLIHASPAATLALKIGVLALYVVSLVLFRVITRREITKVRELVLRGAT